MSEQELTDMQQSNAPNDHQKQDRENSASYSIKFDYYDETDADANAVSELQSEVQQQKSKDLQQKQHINDSIYDKEEENVDKVNTTTTAIGGSKGEQKEMFIQEIELNTIKTANISHSKISNANNVAQMPSMQQILGELKLNLRGQYLELQVDGETVICKINNITPTAKVESGTNMSRGRSISTLSSVQPTNTGGILTKREKRKGKVELLVKDSTNRWLYVNDIDPDGEENCCDSCNRCSNGCVNKFIAVIVIIIQIIAYVTITWFLIEGIRNDQLKRSETCYGPNCDDWSFIGDACMELTTGALISVMLVGFLWADVINAFGTCKYNMLASFLCLLELFTAMICGFLTAIYTPNAFDAISGAIGILFVHDLDERVYASMLIISRRKRTALVKKLLAVLLWIVLSFSISYAARCEHNSGSVIPDASCERTEYKCDSGVTNCIWKGFVCNGIQDCDDGSDEGVVARCDYAAFLASATPGVDYPIDTFMCLSTGTFLKNTTRCDGKLDCDDGSDEGRASNCSEFVFRKKCGQGLKITTADDNWHQTWSGQFKCNNGQCIDAQYACDGIAGDCVDFSDEYPVFDQSLNAPLLISRCPYSQLRQCQSTQALCKVDGKCINKNKLCDGFNDCEDGQDEQGCKYECASNNLAAQTQFQCGGKIAAINDTHIILFESIVDPRNELQNNPNEDNRNELQNNPNATIINGSIGNTEISYSDDAELLYLIGLFTAEDTGECVPYEWRCDGLPDCADRSDEELCTLFTCNPITEYQCKTSGICISQQSLCDYVADCADGSDEILKHCQAFNRSFDDNSANVCKDLGYCFSDPCEFELCPGQDAYECFYNEYKCDGICDCSECGDEGQEFDCVGDGVTPAPTQIQMFDNYLGTISCYGVKSGNINIGSRNFYTFSLPSHISYEFIEFTTCDIDTQLDTVLYLYDSTNTQIATNDDHTDAFECFESAAASIIVWGAYDVFNNTFNPQFNAEEKYYTIEVGGLDDEISGLYSLTCDCFGIQTQVIKNDLGNMLCNDEKSGNINIGTRNVYTFSIPPNNLYANVQITTCHIDTRFDSALYLYGSSNTTIGYSDWDESCADMYNSSTIDFNNGSSQFQEGVNYTIEVGGYADEYFGQYTLIVNCSM